MNARRYLALPVLLGTLLAGAGGAGAQSAASPATAASAAPAVAAHPHHRGALRRALDTVNLTTDQKTQIRGFMKSFHDSRNSTNPETREQLTAQIDGVLTPEQRTQFSTAMQHQRELRKAARAAAPTAAP